MNGFQDGTLPLTTAQRGLWVGQKIATTDATMNIAEAIEIFGPIDPQLFRRALEQVVGEAQTLRVRIIEQDGKPRQIVRPVYEGDFPYMDFSTQADPRAVAEAWMRAELLRSVDLARDPLWVAALFKIAEDRYFWYQRAHHVVYDGHSGGMIVRRVAELYTAYVEGREPAPCPFGSLAALIEAEAAYRGSDRLSRDRNFWLEQLANLPEPVTLARRPRSSVGGLRHSIGYLPIAAVKSLDELGKRCSASLPQVLIALIAAYYHRATGANDLVFGMPVSGRISAALRASPGMVANAVTIRLSFTAETTAAQLFAQVSRVVRQALRHQQYRYEDLRRDLGLIGQSQHIAWLGINIEPFDYQLNFGGAHATSHNLSNGSQEDLTVFIFDRGNDNDVCVYFDANPGLYSMAELDEHRRRLMRLLDAVLADPEKPLRQIDILGDAERERLLFEWNDTAAPISELGLPALIAQQAALTPDATAVVFEDTVLSYRELHARSVLQARRLIADGVLPGDIIAVAMPRSEQLLIVLLAIMRTGAAYLPLDLNAPPERITMMLDDASPIALIAPSEMHARLAHAGVLLLTPEEVAPVDGTPLEPDQATPGTSAYVLYTSGSSGRPKAVEVTHHSLNNFLQAMRQQLAPCADDRFLAVSTVIFDIAALELFLPLTVGARVVIAGDDSARNPLALAQLIRSCGATHLQATPSLWQVLLACPETRLDGVHVLVGGEALSGELAAMLQRQAARVTQFYGPTETTVWSTAFELSEIVTDAAPPIGRPILNTRLYVLDEARQPVITGAIGELYIGGAGVAKGYLHHPQLTVERFPEDPFTADGSRMYRTGDLVRWRDEGVLEFIGRADSQVKIRGHRVELGEIEHQLLQHAAVAAAAVAAHREAGDRRMSLAAYLVPAANTTLDTDAMRGYLAGRLPEHMIPSTYMALQALPLTPNGKLDRKALPVPERASRATYATPTTPVEMKLAALWREILKLERVGIHDNFFELGGDSMTAATMVARFPEYFSMELPLGSLFEASTIAGLAAYLQRADTHSDPLATVLPLRASGQERPLFCLHPVVGLSWAYASVLRQLDGKLPVYGLQSRGLRGGPLPGSIEEIAVDYIAQMQRIQARGPYRLLGWSLGGLIGHAMTAQLRMRGEHVELLAMMDSYPFVIDQSPKDEAHEVQAVLRFLGFHRLARENPPKHMDALADLLCRQYDVFSLPLVREIMNRDPRLIEHVTAVTRNNLSLARKYAPSRIDADMLFFHATGKENVDLDGILQYHPKAWRPYVGGRILVHKIDCHHQAMLEPTAAAQIGRVLRHSLDALQSTADAIPATPMPLPVLEPVRAYG